MTAPLSPAEQATVARFDAGPDAPESLREQVARAVCATDETVDGDHWTWDDADDAAREVYRRMADAAISVLTPPAQTRRRPGGQPGAKPRGICATCGRDVATYRGLAWYHYPPGRGHPNCAGVGKPVVTGGAS